jgi:inositol-phosphate phosphatase/L-galactose 1-phosphate phosphatase/histidinol-phosphatase
LSSSAEGAASIVSSSGSFAGDFLPFAHTLADAAAGVVRRYYRAPVSVETKADASPVTIADQEAERALRELIRSRFPEHGIDGEEFGAEQRDAEFVWHLDPIDGTKSFITGRPLFGTLIGLSRAGKPLLGVIDQCILNERWVGVAGGATTWNDQVVEVRPCPKLDQAVLYATSPLMFHAGEERAAFARVADAVRYPLFGSDCYAYGLVAMGFADLIVEADLDAHDFMPLVPVIEAAGGIMTDWQGRELTHSSHGQVVAAGDRRVHAQALELLVPTDRDAR